MPADIIVEIGGTDRGGSPRAAVPPELRESGSVKAWKADPDDDTASETRGHAAKTRMAPADDLRGFQ